VTALGCQNGERQVLVHSRHALALLSESDKVKIWKDLIYQICQ
jgi:hypothetical protein